MQNTTERNRKKTPMKWKKYTFKTNTQSVDLISATLGEVGVEGIEIEDKVPLTEEETKGMFIDILPDLGEDDGTATISFYLDPEQNIPAILDDVKEALNELREWSDIGECEITESETQDQDWINNWKEFFKPLWVGDVLIKPTWEELPEGTPEDATVVIMDPGTAFGTGGHETTQLCMTQLEKYILQLREHPLDAAGAQGIEMLDIGTGSGILAITALKLGVAHVYGTDLDDAAIEAVGQNKADNGITDGQFEVVCGNIVDDRTVQDAAGYEKYDIVTANILAPVIIALAGEVAQHMKHGGYFITSGIIDTKEEDVKAAFAARDEWELIEVNHQGEWVNVTVRRR